MTTSFEVTVKLQVNAEDEAAAVKNVQARLTRAALAPEMNQRCTLFDTRIRKSLPRGVRS